MILKASDNKLINAAKLTARDIPSCSSFVRYFSFDSIFNNLMFLDCYSCIAYSNCGVV